LLTGDRKISEALRAAFPLQGGEYDFYLPNSPWQIGLSSTHPEELKRKIVASIVSEHLGLRSVDNVLKNYLAGETFPKEDGNRLDHRIRSFVSENMSDFASMIRYVSWLPNKEFCKVISEWTLLRAPFSMEFLAYCGQRGALFEALAIARMMFEQLAWAFAINTEVDETAVHKLSAPRAITPLKVKFPFAGRLYGWLSGHVHWAFDGHKKSMISKKRQAGHLFASSYFKAVIFAIMILFSKLYMDVAWELYADQLRTAPATLIKRYDKPTLAEECAVLLSQIHECDADDEDLTLLSSMLG
jgi:hypothetical protein